LGKFGSERWRKKGGGVLPPREEKKHCERKYQKVRRWVGSREGEQSRGYSQCRIQKKIEDSTSNLGASAVCPWGDDSRKRAGRGGQRWGHTKKERGSRKETFTKNQ